MFTGTLWGLSFILWTELLLAHIQLEIPSGLELLTDWIQQVSLCLLFTALTSYISYAT